MWLSVLSNNVNKICYKDRINARLIMSQDFDCLLENVWRGHRGIGLRLQNLYVYEACVLFNIDKYKVLHLGYNNGSGYGHDRRVHIVNIDYL